MVRKRERRLKEPMLVSAAAKEFGISHRALAAAARWGGVRAEKITDRCYMVERADAAKLARELNARPSSKALR